MDKLIIIYKKRTGESVFVHYDANGYGIYKDGELISRIDKLFTLKSWLSSQNYTIHDIQEKY